MSDARPTRVIYINIMIQKSNNPKITKTTQFIKQKLCNLCIIQNKYLDYLKLFDVFVNFRKIEYVESILALLVYFVKPIDISNIVFGFVGFNSIWDHGLKNMV